MSGPLPFQLFSLLSLGLLGLACHHDDGSPKESDSPGTASDTDSDTSSDSGSGSDSETQSLGWEGVNLTAVNAPTRNSVQVVFSRNPGGDKANLVDAYSLRRGQNSLAIEAVDYDPATRTASLTTAAQVLGVNYLLEILEDQAPVPGLTGVLRAADTATFWVADWTVRVDAERQLTARRAAVGEHCVIYVEEGESSSNAQAAATAFDQQIYQLETEVFTAAPDQDGNGLITLLWLDGQGYFGGYFNPVNTYASTLTEAWWGLHSNEMELLHLDSGSMQAGLDYFVEIAAHELQHLLYNERHGNQEEYWAYHDEGLAEMAVHLVTGKYDYAVDFFLDDSQDLIGNGLSLVNWTYSLYENYVLAYLFWTYTAGQLGGLQTLSDIFDLETGHPEEVDAYLRAILGASLPQAHQRTLIAAWAQQKSGIYSFEGLLDLAGRQPPSVTSGTRSVDLQPFAGAFFQLSASEVSYPGTKGEHIEYVGIDAAGNVDTEEPFSVEGGALLATNTNFEYTDFPAEASGPDLPAQAAAARQLRHFTFPSPTWINPPPVTPDHIALLEGWKTVRRLALSF